MESEAFTAFLQVLDFLWYSFLFLLKLGALGALFFIFSALEDFFTTFGGLK